MYEIFNKYLIVDMDSYMHFLITIFQSAEEQRHKLSLKKSELFATLFLNKKEMKYCLVNFVRFTILIKKMPLFE